MTPAILAKMTHRRGTLWDDGYQHFGPMEDEQGNPIAEPCLYCRLKFTDKSTGALGYELNSDPGTGQGSINIVDSVNYEFDRISQALPLKAGEYEWEFQTYRTSDHSDLPITIFIGDIEVT